MSSLLAKIRPTRSSGSKPTNKRPHVTQAKGGSAAGERPAHMKIVATSYTSSPVDVAPEFLKTTVEAGKMTSHFVDFGRTVLPEYDGCFAVVLDGIMDSEECDQLIAYAEESAGVERRPISSAAQAQANGEEKEVNDADSDNKEPVENNGWKPAMVNAGPGKEVLMTDYRNSDRIIWDDQDMMDRLWERCLLAPGVKERLARIEHQPLIQGIKAAERGDRWHFKRLNQRMRFLKYGAGQFFKEHCDGSYQVPKSDPEERSFVTLHLYLNDSIQALKPSASPGSSFPPPPNEPDLATLADVTLQGGATTFHSQDMKRRLDVDPKVGRVLIFQHKDLLHSGDSVTAGIKYTMRTDLMYEFEPYE